MIESEQAGQYELMQDINTPNGYWRAGTRKDRNEWEEIFPGCFDNNNSEDWFFDHNKYYSPLDMGDEKDEIAVHVRDVFDKLGLRSITYRRAAVQAVHSYRNKQMNLLIDNIPDAVVKILCMPIIKIYNTKSNAYLSLKTSQLEKWATEHEKAQLFTISRALEVLRLLGQNDDLEMRVFHSLVQSDQTE